MGIVVRMGLLRQGWIFLLLSVSVQSAVAVKRDSLQCSLCVDIVTDLENWVTSDTTEDQKSDWISGVCDLISVISQDLENTCSLVLHAEIPVIIEDIISGLNPNQICNSLNL